MTNANINYSAVLADLESRKAELESAIAAIKTILAAGGGIVNGGVGDGGAINPENIPVGAFLTLSIADAVKKYLDMVKTKQNVPQILRALERGGLPPAKQNTVYAVLRRRESTVGDIIRMGDEWALSEWYPNNPNLRKRTPANTRAKENPKKAAPAKKKKISTTKPKVASPKKAASPKGHPDVEPPVPSPSDLATAFTPTLSTPDLMEELLITAGRPLDSKVISERLNTQFGKNTNPGFLKSLLAHDKQKRFVNVSDNIWDLSDRTEK